MHANNIIVKERDIKFTEKILLSEGQTFDELRCDYIKDFETLDLMAVPGSGKTTLLLSKLLIMERNLPLKNNTGILVLSHTNIAISEIRDKLGMFCPRLFDYPNFIGTIQSFVNKYLALPYYEMTYKKPIKIIDDKIYYEYIEDYYGSMKDYSLKGWLNNQHDPIGILKRIRLDENDNLINNIQGSEENFILKDKLSKSYIGLKRMKENLLNYGILHFDDAYYLASKYINSNPRIINLIQRRFRYIFIDEMQDMDVHQYLLLEKIVSNNTSNSTFQRLGDNNQAIYSYDVKSDTVWKNKDKIHTISGSNRLTRMNANLASRFSIDNSFIEGLNSTNKEYKPVLLVYDGDKVECSVIKTFSGYLNELFKDEQINNITYKVISWRRNHDDKDKIALSSYCPKSTFMIGDNNSLGAPINNNYDYHTITETIKNIIVDKLNNLDIEIDKQGVTKSSLTRYLRENKKDTYDKYKLCIYRCVQHLLDNNYNMIYEELNIFLSEIGVLFNNISRQDNPMIFLENELIFTKEVNHRSQKCNLCDVMGKSPIINTVHSVKGETHDVTLFLESFYNSKYESDILHEVLCGNSIFELIKRHESEIENLHCEINKLISEGKERGIKVRKKRIQDIESRIRLKRQYAKLVYVALTRAKSVIGYGLSKDRYNQYLKEKINDDEWEIIFID